MLLAVDEAVEGDHFGVDAVAVVETQRYPDAGTRGGSGKVGHAVLRVLVRASPCFRFEAQLLARTLTPASNFKQPVLGMPHIPATQGASRGLLTGLARRARAAAPRQVVGAGDRPRSPPWIAVAMAAQISSNWPICSGVRWSKSGRADRLDMARRRTLQQGHALIGEHRDTAPFVPLAVLAPYQRRPSPAGSRRTSADCA